MAVTEGGDPVAGKTARAVPVVDHDEVVSGPVHLGELEKHSRSITPKARHEKNEGERKDET